MDAAWHSITQCSTGRQSGSRCMLQYSRSDEVGTCKRIFTVAVSPRTSHRGLDLPTVRASRTRSECVGAGLLFFFLFFSLPHFSTILSTTFYFFFYDTNFYFQDGSTEHHLRYVNHSFFLLNKKYTAIIWVSKVYRIKIFKIETKFYFTVFVTFMELLYIILHSK